MSVELEADVARSKRELRQVMRTRRMTIPPDEAALAEAAACQCALGLPFLRGLGTVALYRAIRGELATTALEAALVAAGARVVLPRVDAAAHGTLLTFHAPDAGLVPGSMGLSEPPADAPVVPLGEIDAFILPGLAFDARGARLGWGRGHFDVTLAAAPRALRLGWAYAFQLIASVPEGTGDQRVDLIITDAGAHLTGARPLPLSSRSSS